MMLTALAPSLLATATVQWAPVGSIACAFFRPFQNLVVSETLDTARTCTVAAASLGPFESFSISKSYVAFQILAINCGEKAFANSQSLQQNCRVMQQPGRAVAMYCAVMQGREKPVPGRRLTHEDRGRIAGW